MSIEFRFSVRFFVISFFVVFQNLTCCEKNEIMSTNITVTWSLVVNQFNFWSKELVVTYLKQLVGIGGTKRFHFHALRF